MRKYLERFLVLTVLLGVLLLPVTAFAEEQRVYDGAGLFSTEEVLQLEASITSLRTQIGMDVVIVTTNNAEGKSAQAYADDFYDTNGFGTGDDRDGTILLIDLDSRELIISTTGTMMRYLTDDRRNAILDHIYTYAGTGDFYSAASTFLQEVAIDFEEGIVNNQHNYDTETGKSSYYRSVSGGQIALFALIAIVVGVGVCFIVKAKYQMRLFSGYKYPYHEKSKLELTTSTDEFMNQFITSRKIPQAPPPGNGGGGGGISSTYTSSSGTTHSSSGRKF